MAARKRKTPAEPTAPAKRPDQIDIMNAYKQVFSTPEGQVVVADLLRHFAYNRLTTFVPAGTVGRTASRPEDTFFREGQRSVIIHIGNMVDAQPAQYEDQGKVEQ